MKIRIDFVTNSSSSSFVAVLDAVLEDGNTIRAVDDSDNGGEESGTIIVENATGKMNINQLKYTKALQDVIVRYDGAKSRIVSGSLSLKCHAYGETVWKANPENLFDKYTIGNAYKKVKSYLPTKYDKEQTEKRISELKKDPELSQLTDDSIHSLIKYIYADKIEPDTEIIQTFHKDGTEEIVIENGKYLFNIVNDWRYFNDIPDQVISFVETEEDDDSPSIENKTDISRYIPKGVKIFEYQQKVLAAIVELFAKQEHVRMEDVANYLSTNNNNVRLELKVLQRKGVLTLSNDYEIRLRVPDANQDQ